MNPSHSLQVPQLTHPFKHAGGWEKLGWRTLDADHGFERVADLSMLDDEDAEPGLFS